MTTCKYVNVLFIRRPLTVITGNVQDLARVFEFIERRLQPYDHVVENVREQRQAEGGCGYHVIATCKPPTHAQY